MSSESATKIDWYSAMGPFVHALEPMLPILIPLVLLAGVLASPLPGRGPTSRRRDPWRTFKYDLRGAVMLRAGNRCEGVDLWFVARCREPATEADHIYPWSKGGGTVLSNGQALCRRHNLHKGRRTPAWWELVLLERRRRRYFPQGASVRVDGALPRHVRLAHYRRQKGRG